MSTFEVLTLVTSIMAIMIAAYSLYVSYAGAYLSWEREHKRPYYQDVIVFLKSLNRDFLGDDLGVYRKPDATELIHRATALGLTSYQTDLEFIMIRINELDSASFYDDPATLEKAKVWLSSLKHRCESLEDDMYREIERLTKKPVLFKSKYRT